MSSIESKPWRFLSNHTQVLLCISQDPDARLREIAQRVEITERAAHRIVTDLINSGYLQRVRVGRRNRYLVNPSAAMRHPAQHGQEIGGLLGLLGVTDLRGDEPTPGARGRAEQAGNREARRPPQEDQQGAGGIPA